MTKTLSLCYFVLVIGCGYIHLWCLRARQKFTSFWKGPYTIVDKIGEVNYKIQLIGDTQAFVVHRID